MPRQAGGRVVTKTAGDLNRRSGFATDLPGGPVMAKLV